MLRRTPTQRRRYRRQAMDGASQMAEQILKMLRPMPLSREQLLSRRCTWRAMTTNNCSAGGARG